MTNQAILHLLENYGSVEKAAKHSGMSLRAFRKAAKEARAEKSDGQPVIVKEEPPAACSIEAEASKDGQVITLKSSTIRTLDAALKAADVDMKLWEVERWVANKWDVAAKNAEKDLVATELWQVKVFLKRKMPKPISDAIGALIGKAFHDPIVYKTLPVTDLHLLEISLYDAHFGKLCWGPETNNSGDLRLSRIYYQQAVEKLLSRVSGYPIDRILFPIGNDFFHINNWLNTTAKGTIQDVDSRMSKIFEVGCEAVMRAVDRCVQVAPVDLLWIPGNHDPETSWFMAKVLEAYYRNTPQVRINTSPLWRKYIHYGCTLLGYTHGNEEKESDLPTLMAVEQPDLWARSTCRGWRLGHYHTKRQRKYTAGDTINGITVDYLPSLSATDAWHFRKGYVGNPKAGEAWLWSQNEGYVAQFAARV